MHYHKVLGDLATNMAGRPDDLIILMSPDSVQRYIKRLEACIRNGGVAPHYQPAKEAPK
jgi:hypothetical protein